MSAIHLSPGVYDIDISVMAELMNNDVNGLLTKDKKSSRSTTFHLLINKGITVLHAIVTRGDQIVSSMRKEQLQALFYGILGECPEAIRNVYSIKAGSSPISHKGLDVIYFLVDTCPYPMPVFLDNDMYFISIKGDEVILGGTPLSNWNLDEGDLIHWLIRCNPLNFEEAEDMPVTSREAVTTRGSIKYVTCDEWACIWDGNIGREAHATNRDYTQEVLNNIFHEVPVGDLSYAEFVYILKECSKSVSIFDDATRIRFNYGVNVTYTILKNAYDKPITNAPINVLSCIVANWYITNGKYSKLKELTGIFNYVISPQDTMYKCNSKSKSVLYMLLKLIDYPIVFKSGDTYYTVVMTEGELRVTDTNLSIISVMNSLTGDSFSYSLVELIDVVKKCIPIGEVRLLSYEIVSDFDNLWHCIKTVKHLTYPFELKVGTIGPYLCMMRNGSFMITNASPRRLSQRCSLTPNNTLGELLDMYCALDKSTDYTTVIVTLLHSAGVSDRVHDYLCEQLLKK